MPGCGKSTLGLQLAQDLSYNFIDVDTVIEKRENKTLQEIIDNDGLDIFNKAEENALLSLDCDNTIISTGGSAVYSESGMNHIKKNAKTIYINVSLPEIKKRLVNLSTRGIAGAKEKTIEQLFDERKPLYEKYADFIINFDNSDVAFNTQKIISFLGKSV